MSKKTELLLKKIRKNSKIVFPIIVFVAVVITVVISLSMSEANKDKIQQIEVELPPVVEEIEPVQPEPVGDIALKPCDDSLVKQLVTSYFTALADGDSDKLNSMCDFIEEDKMLEITELAKFVEKYDNLEIYTKPGYTEDANVAYVCYDMLFTGKEVGYPGYRTLYVCKDELGKNFLKFQLSDEENDYIVTVSGQADVVDMNNKVAVAYNDLMTEKPELLKYLSEVHNEVQVAMGVIFGQQVTGEGNEEETPVEEENQEAVPEQPTEKRIFAKTSDTVNVRVSDSQQADKLGKASKGTQVEVIEQLVNGWSKVIFDGKEGYIRSDFLVVQDGESSAGMKVIGKIKADSNVNVRAEASETADRLGMLTGGSTADLLAKENGWCKISYEGKVGYVKAEFVKEQ